MKLLLHIGTEKTGTTALQSWLHDNAQALVAEKIWVCRSLEVENNFGAVILAAGLESWPDLLNPLSIRTKADLEVYTTRATAELRDEVAAAREQGCETFVISSEHLHSRVRRKEHLLRLSGYLGEHFADITGVLFLRPQADLSRSVQSNHVRWGVPISRKTFLDTAKGHNYDYWGIYKLWSEAFPLELDVVPYKRFGDTIKWFCDHLGLNVGAFARSERRVKTSISMESAAFLNAISVGLPAGPEHVAMREHIIAKMQGGGPLTFRNADQKRIARRFRRGNKKLCQSIEGLERDDLEADPSQYTKKGSVEALSGVDFSTGLKTLFGP